MFRLSYADAESVTEVLRGVLGQQEGASNPVARALSPNAGRFDRFNRDTSSPISSLAASNALQQAAQGGAAPQGSAPPLTGNQSAPVPQGFSTPDLTIQPAPELNAIVVRGTPSAIAGLEPLIADLDVRRPQVMIEAAIAEITGDDAEALGIQLGTSGAALNSVEGAGTSFSTAGPSLGQILSVLKVPAGAILGEGLTANVAIGNDFSILVQALGISTKANLLSVPQVTVLDNMPAEIVVGQNVPFVNRIDPDRQQFGDALHHHRPSGRGHHAAHHPRGSTRARWCGSRSARRPRRSPPACR
ncbi:MAG: secretin N-terminal domain-containing protein [Sphingomonas sp.]